MVAFMRAVIIDNHADITVVEAVFIDNRTFYIFMAEKIQERHTTTWKTSSAPHYKNFSV
jgi:hypothetical protein